MSLSDCIEPDLEGLIDEWVQYAISMPQNTQLAKCPDAKMITIQSA